MLIVTDYALFGCEQVAEKIAEGWQPFGSPVAEYHETCGTRFWQAMVKYANRLQ